MLDRIAAVAGNSSSSPSLSLSGAGMKCASYIFAAFAVLLTAGHALAVHHERQSRASYDGLILSSPVQSPTFDLCPTCIDFSSQALGRLREIVLHHGFETCAAVSDALAAHTGNRDLGLVCNLLCAHVGVGQFLEVIEHPKLDPINFCELLGVCRMVKNGDAKITSLEVHPASGHQAGKMFAIAYSWTTMNGTGTGQIAMDIATDDKLPVHSSALSMPRKPGSYAGAASLSTDTSGLGGCDASQGGACQQWLPGVYQVKLSICNGECDSSHPRDNVYDTAEASFKIPAEASTGRV
ncbi:countin-3-like [Sycon ciliatum]|uniref:countin-3-like n=1 Tax=Sycon ciliatum TaxID=27933 RepID=UPI0031F70140